MESSFGPSPKFPCEVSEGLLGLLRSFGATPKFFRNFSEVLLERLQASLLQRLSQLLQMSPRTSPMFSKLIQIYFGHRSSLWSPNQSWNYSEVFLKLFRSYVETFLKLSELFRRVLELINKRLLSDLLRSSFGASLKLYWKYSKVSLEPILLENLINSFESSTKFLRYVSEVLLRLLRISFGISSKFS